MPIKKKPVSEKEKLQAKTIDQLKRYAKKVGAKIVTPEGKPKTKQQLVNSALMASRLGKKAPGLKAKAATSRKTLGAGRISPLGVTFAKAKALQKKRDLIRKYIDEIIEVGPNYAVWQNAQGAYKNAKAIEKLLRNW
jgi:hypothetical protein